MIVRDRLLKIGEGSIQKKMRGLLKLNSIFISNKKLFQVRVKVSDPQIMDQKMRS